MKSVPQELKNIQFSHIYVHIPFCEVLCHYCDFYIERSKDADFDSFFNALKKEANHWKAQCKSIKSIYFGGGTPSLAPEKLIGEFLDIFSSEIDDQTEICLEANPCSITEAKLKNWKIAGINRLSIGTQSLDDQILKKLSRTHSAEMALSSLEKSRHHFKNVSADLIYGIPHQDINAPAKDAKLLVERGAQHISAYTLTLNKQHFLYHKLLSSDQSMDQSEAIFNQLESLNFSHYESSNYCRPNFASLHNQAYWTQKPYLALGPSAHGFNGASFRWQNMANWRKYVEYLNNNNLVISSTETISPQQQKMEYIFTRLRTQNGINLNKINDLYENCPQKMQSVKLLQNQLISQAYAQLSKDRLQLNFRGMMLSDEISSKFCEFL